MASNSSDKWQLTWCESKRVVAVLDFFLGDKKESMIIDSFATMFIIEPLTPFHKQEHYIYTLQGLQEDYIRDRLKQDGFKNIEILYPRSGLKEFTSTPGIKVTLDKNGIFSSIGEVR